MDIDIEFLANAKASVPIYYVMLVVVTATVAAAATASPIICKRGHIKID